MLTEELDGTHAVQSRVAKSIRMVVGVTSAQTCLVLTGRLKALREAGFEVTLCSSPGELFTQRATSEGATPFPISMKREIAPLSDFISFLRLLRMLARIRPEVTDFSTPKAGLLGNLAAWLFGVPHRVYTLRGLKLESSRGIKRALLLLSERLAARCADVVLCNSESLMATALALRIAPESKMRLLGDGSSNGVDTQRFSPGVSTVRRKLDIQTNEFVLGFVGRLTTNKGVPELLDAFEKILEVIPRCWLLMVGWFDEAEDALPVELRRVIEKHPRVLHIGFVEDVTSYYRAMDLMILPTHREGFPNAVLEAAACGLPVITTDTTGARDAVLSHITGLLIPPGNSGAIAEAALKLLREPMTRRRMGLSARTRAVERFSKERVLALAIEFYSGLVARDCRPRNPV